jgi:hypothetical protein
MIFPLKAFFFLQNLFLTFQLLTEDDTKGFVQKLIRDKKEKIIIISK